MQFALLVDLYEKGRTLDKNARVDAINKFLAVSDPGVEGRVRWGWLLKGNRAENIVNLLRWGLDRFRDGKPFMRSGPSDDWGSAQAFDGDGILWDRLHARIVRVASSEPEDLFLTRIFELFTEVAPWLRICQREECKKFFLFQRPKQIYCSDTCAQQVRMARFLEKRKPVVRGQTKKGRK
jgi:hypothetical protein